jgi:hypothetical protein
MYARHVSAVLASSRALWRALVHVLPLAICRRRYTVQSITVRVSGSPAKARKHSGQPTLVELRQAGGPRATPGLRPLVTRPAKVSINLLVITTSSCALFPPKDLKNRDSYLTCCFMFKCHTCYGLKAYRNMQVFHEETASDASCCRNKFKICNP